MFFVRLEAGKEKSNHTCILESFIFSLPTCQTKNQSGKYILSLLYNHNSFNSYTPTQTYRTDFTSYIMKKPTYNNRNSKMVKNLNGTSKPKYVIHALKTKYVKAGGCLSSTCQHKSCSKPVSATAHVKHTDGRKGNAWYLTSLCATHNHTSNKDLIALRKNAKVVAVIDLTK